MSPRRRQPSRKPRGVIVWDFDRVLFDTELFYRGAKEIFKKYGVPPPLFWKMVLTIRKKKYPFSTARALHILRQWKIKIPEKKIRKEIHSHLALTNYFTADTDALLHRLRKRGFNHIILSSGAASYLRKRVLVGCGERFARHFVKISATIKPKHSSLKKLAEQYSPLPIFFVDDTKSHIELVEKYVPRIVTIHYTHRWSLRKVERTILAHLGRKYAETKDK